MKMITCTANVIASAKRIGLSQISCLRASERDRCEQFINENDINEERFVRLYHVAKQVKFGSFESDYTQFGASQDESRMVQQLFLQGLNFHQLERFLILQNAKRMA